MGMIGSKAVNVLHFSKDRENGAALFKDPEFETCLNNSGFDRQVYC